VPTAGFANTLATNGSKAPLIIDANPIIIPTSGDLSHLPEEYTITELIHKPDRQPIRAGSLAAASRIPVISRLAGQTDTPEIDP
jgi:hypothetical protein